MSVLELLQKNSYQTDFNDLEVVNSSVEYSESGNLHYLLYELNVRNSDGEYLRLYKAIKLHRLIRVPKSAKQLKSFMDIQGDVIAGMYQQKINFVQIIANILEPKPIGLLFLYGVQAVSTESMEEAKRLATNDFAALTRVFGGSFRTMEMRVPTYEEMEWLRTKMHGMKHLQVIRGLPAARKAPGDMNASSLSGGSGNSETQETSEEFIIGMSDYEYVAVLMATPIEQGVLNAWLTATSRDQTRWEGLKQGSKATSFGLSLPMMYMANLGSSSGWSSGFSEGNSINHSDSISLSESDSISHGTTVGHTEGVSEGLALSQQQGVAVGHTEGTTVGHTEGTAVTDGVAKTHTVGTSETESVSDSTGTSHSVGRNWSDSESQSQQHSVGTSHTVTDGTSESRSSSHSKGTSLSNSQSESASTSQSKSHTDTTSVSNGVVDTQGRSKSNTVSGNFGGSIGPIKVGAGGSHGWGETETHGRTHTEGNSASDGSSVGTSQGVSSGVTSGRTEQVTSGISRGTNHSVSNGTSETFSEGTSKSHSEGGSETFTTSQTHTTGRSTGRSESWGETVSHSVTKSASDSVSNSKSDSVTNSQSQGQTASVGKSSSDSVSQSVTKSHSTGRTQGSSDGWGKNYSQNQGFTGALTQASAGTMGIGPSLSWSKNYQWKDIEVENIVTLLEFQRQRLLSATNGQGAYFVDFMIATPNEEAKASAAATTTSAWLNDHALVSPLQVLDLPKHEENYLFYHMNAFSPSLLKEGIPGQLESYKYSTVLLADELAAYSHPPRVSEGGLYAEVDDIPVLAVPSNRQDGEIYLGQIISGERYSTQTGYVTPFQFRIRSDELHHAYFSGASRSGKTELALRVVAEMANHVRRGPYEKRLRIIAMDPKKDWRRLAKFIEPERFRFYSLADPDFLPVKLNLTKIPKNVWPERYMNSVVEIFVRSYGLGERGKQILTRAFFEEYTKAGVFKPDWRQHATERSSQVTMATIYENLARKREEMDDPRGKVKYGNDARDAFTRVMDRMEAFGRVGSINHAVFCDPNGQGIDELLGNDDVVVLESYGLESTTRSFVFGLITSAIYQYAVHNGGFVKPKDQYETILVIEEANEVLLGQDTADKSGGGVLPGPSEFERIVDQAAGNGLFIWSITQKISKMPNSIIANCGLVFAGRQKVVDDVVVNIRQIGREERFDDRPLVKWFPKCPTGWFIVGTSRTFDFKDAEASMVKVERLKSEEPTDEELIQLTKIREVKLLQKTVKEKKPE